MVREWIEPPFALPVTVAGDLLLVRRPGLLAWIGALCAYPEGFTFYLTIGLDQARVADSERMITFHGHSEDEWSRATRLQVRFSDGQAADSKTRMHDRAADEPVLRFAGGPSEVREYHPVPRSESRWWVSPLPPPGPVEFTIFLQGAAEPTGTVRADAELITKAAARSRMLQPGTGTGPW